MSFVGVTRTNEGTVFSAFAAFLVLLMLTCPHDTRAATPDLNQHGLTGSWFEPATSGQGIELEFFADLIAPGKAFVQGAWFTYESAPAGGPERQRWYTFNGPGESGQANVPIIIYQNVGGNFDAPPITSATVVGSGTLTFSDCSNATLTYLFTDGTGRNGVVALTRLLPNVTCTIGATPTTNVDFGFSGNWFASATAGQGFVFEVNPVVPYVFLTWYTYAPMGQAAGAAGQRWFTGQATNYAPGSRVISMGLNETTGGLFDKPSDPGPSTTTVGTATLTFASCTSAQIEFNFTGGSSAGRSDTIPLSRVGPVPPGCGAGGPLVAYSVAAVKDDSRSVSKQIDPSGGTLTATGADGTLFTLTIPPNAIFFPTVVTMTPLDHVDRFPFSGGLDGGVHLEPEGLILMQPATLTIKPVTAIPAAQLAPFNYSGEGDGLILYPAIASPAGFQLPVSHFSGYGVGTGNASAAPNAASSGPFDPYVQQIAQVQAQLGADQLSPAEANAQIEDLLTQAFNNVVIPTVQAVGDCSTDSIRSAVRMGYQYVAFEESFGDKTNVQARRDEVYSNIKTLATACVDQAFATCVAQNDTGQSELMLSIGAALSFNFVISDVEYNAIWEKMERCLRFEVDFDSQITEHEVTGYEHFQHVRAVVPVRLTKRNDSAFLLSGQATNQFLLATTTYLQGTPCSVTIQTYDGVFEVGNLDTGGFAKREEINVKMAYLPGSPTETDTITCDNVSVPTTVASWPVNFGVIHADELLPSDPANPLYITRGWLTNPSGALIAQKTYQGTTPVVGSSLTELTTMLLRHTPDAP